MFRYSKSERRETLTAVDLDCLKTGYSTSDEGSFDPHLMKQTLRYLGQRLANEGGYKVGLNGFGLSEP